MCHENEKHVIERLVGDKVRPLAGKPEFMSQLWYKRVPKQIKNGWKIVSELRERGLGIPIHVMGGVL